MGVKAMFYVNNVGHNASGVGTVSLNAVAKGPYANWAKSTPNGTINLTSLNEAATQWFYDRLGKDVAITFGDPTDEDLLPNPT